MEIPNDQVEELKTLYPGTCRYDEAGKPFFLIPKVQLPEGCEPRVTDALLCPTARDGYPSRLYVADKVAFATPRNWNASNARIIERNWHAFSWKVRDGLRLAQMVGAHLRGFR